MGQAKPCTCGLPEKLSAKRIMRSGRVFDMKWQMRSSGIVLDLRIKNSAHDDTKTAVREHHTPTPRAPNSKPVRNNTSHFTHHIPTQPDSTGRHSIPNHHQHHITLNHHQHDDPNPPKSFLRPPQGPPARPLPRAAHNRRRDPPRAPPRHLHPPPPPQPPPPPPAPSSLPTPPTTNNTT